MDFGVVDCHLHIFPPLAGACGFPDAATHLMYQQRAMHTHGNQPYRRLRDHAAVPGRPLWDADDPSEAGRRTDVKFAVGRNGRFTWEVDGEAHYLQFLPPHMADLSAPADVMVTQMDYAGVATSVLQNDHIYGNLAEEFAAAQRRFPGRFIGLVQVDEAFAYHDAQMAALHDQVHRLGMSGLYFTTAAFFRNGYRELYDSPAFDPFWREAERLDLPVFWVHSTRSPIGTYEDEMRHLAAVIERFPRLRHVLVHGVPTSIYCDAADLVTLPPVLDTLLREGPVFSELLYPISWGGKHEYPYTRAGVHFRQIFDRYGPRRFVWGSDMPNVERHCTYRQTFTYCWDHFDFLGADDRRLVFRDNTLGLFGARLPPGVGAS